MGGQISVGTTVPGTGTIPPNEPVQIINQEPQDETWQHKYLVLQGKYNAEISRLNANLGEKDTVISQLNRMVADLYQRLGATPPTEAGGSRQANTDSAPAQRNTPRESRFERMEEEDFSGYGEEIKGMARGFNTMVDEVSSLTEEVKTLRGQNVKSAWDVFCEKMNTLLPGWESINDDPAFTGWLQEKDHERDPWTRHEALKHYAKNGDAQSAVKFFDDFNKNVRPNLSVATPSMSDIVQPQISAATNRMPVGTSTGNKVTLEQYTKACQDYANKEITYNQWKVIADTFQNGLPKSGR